MTKVQSSLLFTYAFTFLTQTNPLPISNSEDPFDLDFSLDFDIDTSWPKNSYQIKEYQPNLNQISSDINKSTGDILDTYNESLNKANEIIDCSTDKINRISNSISNWYSKDDSNSKKDQDWSSYFQVLADGFSVGNNILQGECKEDLLSVNVNSDRPISDGLQDAGKEISKVQTDFYNFFDDLDFEDNNFDDLINSSFDLLDNFMKEDANYTTNEKDEDFTIDSHETNFDHKLDDLELSNPGSSTTTPKSSNSYLTNLVNSFFKFLEEKTDLPEVIDDGVFKPLKKIGKEPKFKPRRVYQAEYKMNYGKWKDADKFEMVNLKRRLEDEINEDGSVEGEDESDEYIYQY